MCTFLYLISGTAIYVTCIFASGYTRLGFYLDDTLEDAFVYEWDMDINSQELPSYVFNITVYQNANLSSTGTGPYGAHKLIITSFDTIIFDFAKYT